MSVVEWRGGDTYGFFLVVGKRGWGWRCGVCAVGEGDGFFLIWSRWRGGGLKWDGGFVEGIFFLLGGGRAERYGEDGMADLLTVGEWCTGDVGIMVGYVALFFKKGTGKQRIAFGELISVDLKINW